MDILTLFGVVCVSLMLAAYALEERGGGFVMLFAAACMGSSIYGFLVGAWPFGIVEAVWTIVAVRRWRSRVRDWARTSTKPIACDMTALSAVQRQRYDVLRRFVIDSVEQVTGTTTGFRLRLGSKAPAADVAEWMALEHQCCPFLTLQLALKDDESRWIEIGGSAAIKAFLEEEFKAFAAVRRVSVLVISARNASAKRADCSQRRIVEQRHAAFRLVHRAVRSGTDCGRVVDLAGVAGSARRIGAVVLGRSIRTSINDAIDRVTAGADHVHFVTT